MNQKTIYTLSQLARSIQNVIQQYSSKVIWIKAEIVKLNYYSKSGHCYPALVEKRNGKVIAELRGNIWNNTFENINRKFRNVLKEELKDNMTVVLQGSVTFHPVHGLALNILDIDPEYTLGELARAKSETIQKLQEEAVFNSNKTKNLPLLPKTMAIISVESSKGYQDFLNVINANQWNYKVHHLLFPAILQGERAVTTISQQLEAIRNHVGVFDAVAIIRGGGGEIGLSCFDDYLLARKIATFPIPVLTGIGHATNETVSELVSYQSFITPTKIAEFLLQKFQEFAIPVERAAEKIEKETHWLFKDHRSGLKETARLFNSLTLRAMERNKSDLNHMAQTLFTNARVNFRNEQDELQYLEGLLHGNSRNLLKDALQKIAFSEEKLRLLSPQNILKRGYSITRQKGKAIRQPEDIDPEIMLETTVFGGKIFSHPQKTEKNTPNE